MIPRTKKIKLGSLFVGLVLISLSTVVRAQSKDDIHIALTGDSNLHRRLSVFNDPAYLAFFKRIQAADVSFTNLEAIIHPLNIPGAAFAGGTPGISPAWTVDEIKWAGFNLLSVANNHSLDYGIDGLRSNLHALDAAGFAYAGAGENLAFARAPGYLDTKKGRVALVATSSTLTAGEQASQQRPDLPGRAGVSPLRFTTTYTVDQPTLETLRRVAALGGHSGGRRSADSTELHFANALYKEGDTPSVHTEPDKDDLNALIASITAGKRQAEWVVASIHAHEGKSGNPNEPADFVVTFAHAAIDAGADVFIVHGPHDIRGIEIYKGKPIIYSLGNFVFDGEAGIPFAPSETYEANHLPWNSNISDYREVTSKGDTIGYGADKGNWETAVVEVTFSPDHKLKELTLDPATLGYGLTRSERGFPRPASPEAAKEIINTFTKLSASYGTKVEFAKGRGVIHLDSK